jgi:hypothetical protein
MRHTSAYDFADDTQPSDVTLPSLLQIARIAIASDAGEFALAARPAVQLAAGAGSQAVTRAWNAGSSRIGSKSESPMANER